MKIFSLPSISRIALITMVMLAGNTIPLIAHASKNDWSNALEQAKEHISSITNNGEDAIYLSGYAYHGRHTYTKEKLSELNEHAWGFGYGKTLRDNHGNDASIYGFGLSDSHKQPQLMLGYAYELVWPIAHSSMEVSVGGTAMLMSRRDMFGGVPFPVPLPLASIGTQKAKLMFSYVPRLSQHGNNGDVLLIFARLEL